MKVSTVIPAGSSWRMRAPAIGIAIVALGNAINALLDGDPATMPDWNVVAMALMGAYGLASARDNNVTSEQAGATP